MVNEEIPQRKRSGRVQRTTRACLKWSNKIPEPSNEIITYTTGENHEPSNEVIVEKTEENQEPSCEFIIETTDKNQEPSNEFIIETNEKNSVEREHVTEVQSNTNRLTAAPKRKPQMDIKEMFLGGQKKNVPQSKCDEFLERSDQFCPKITIDNMTVISVPASEGDSLVPFVSQSDDYSESDRELEDEDEQSGETTTTTTNKSGANKPKRSDVEDNLICYKASRDHLGEYHKMGWQSIQNNKDKMLPHEEIRIGQKNKHPKHPKPYRISKRTSLRYFSQQFPASVSLVRVTKSIPEKSFVEMYESTTLILGRSRPVWRLMAQKEKKQLKENYHWIWNNFSDHSLK